MIVGPGVDMREMVEEHGIGTAVDEANAERIRTALLDVEAEQITQWKAAADACAQSLGAEVTSEPWREAVAALVGSDVSDPSDRR